MIKNILKYSLITLIWLAVWQIVAMAVGQELLFPAPLAVLVRLFELCVSREFYKTLGISLLRVVAGMVMGILIGALGGALTAFCRIARDFFSPMLAIVRSTPVASFIILLVLWISRDLTPVVIAAIMVIPVVWSNIETGFLQTDKALLEMADAYKMTRAKKIKHIYMPSVYPYFLSSLRSSLGMSWKAGIAAEVLLQPLVSIGKQIFEAKYMLETVDLFAWTAVVIILSVIIEKVLVFFISSALSSYSSEKMGGGANA